MKSPPWMMAIAAAIAMSSPTHAELSVVDEKIEVTEESEPAPADERPLDELGWIVGAWTDAGGAARIAAECRWTRNESFLTRTFKVVEEDGYVLLEGGQVIGWDPEAGQVRSWTFDSEGGFGEGSWTRDGDRWLIKTRFTLVTGERASALNILTRVDDDTATWASVNREVDGKLQPNQPPVTLVRVVENPAAAEEVSE